MPSSAPPPPQPQSLPPAPPAPRGAASPAGWVWAGVSSCYDAAIGMQGCSRHTRLHCGAIWGGGGGAAYRHRPPAPSPLCLCTVSSGVVFPHYSAAQSCVWGGAGGGGGGALSEPPAQWGPSSGPLTPLPVPIVRARAMPTLRAGRICGGGLWVLQAWPQDWRGLGGRRGGSLV